MATASFEVGNVNALLLDPGVVAEVEHPVALDLAHFEMFGGQANEMVLEHVVGFGVFESTCVVLAHDALTVRVVEVRAIGCDRHDHVVRAEVHCLGCGDRGERVGD